MEQSEISNNFMTECWVQFKKLQPAEVENSVIIPISRPDKINSLGPRNIVGCITSIDNSTYTVGTPQGTISVPYTRIQFVLGPSNVVSIGSTIRVTQTEMLTWNNDWIFL